MTFLAPAAASAPTRPIDAADLYRKMAVAALIFFVVFSIGCFAGARWPYDWLGYVVGRDFVNVWMGGRAVLGGQPSAWYDVDTYNAALQGVFGQGYWAHNWSYPPHLFLFVWPFGLLPYLPSYLLWCGLGLAAFAAAAAGRGLRGTDLLLIAVGPAAAINIFTGQNGFFTAALLVGALTQLDRRPVLAGVLFGLLTFKPQLGLLVPLMLVLRRDWACITAAAVTTATLAALTAAIFGVRVWLDYIHLALPFQRQIMTGGSGIFLAMMPTPFMNVRVAGGPLWLAWSLQGCASALAVAAMVWTFRRRRNRVLSDLVFLTATMLATPYAFDYDMVVFGWALLRWRDLARTPLDHGLGLAVWMLPILVIFLGIAGIPGSCLLLFAFALRLLQMTAQEGTATEDATLPAPGLPAG